MDPLQNCWAFFHNITLSKKIILIYPEAQGTKVAIPVKLSKITGKLKVAEER